MFVRTDFHIYKIKSEEIIQGEKYYNIEIRGGLNKLKAEFGKQADTIEELCDEFRYKFDNFLKHEKCWQDKKTGIWYDSDSDTALNEIEISTIKGAIWTDKGLIYVAKMNEKGELELI